MAEKGFTWSFGSHVHTSVGSFSDLFLYQKNLGTFTLMWFPSSKCLFQELVGLIYALLLLQVKGLFILRGREARELRDGADKGLV